MPRERIATRDAVFEAADTLAYAGEKVTVAAVRDQVGGGSNTSIHELLVELRRQRRNLLTSGRSDGANGTAVALPDTMQAVMARFSAQLGRVWAEELAGSGEHDQLAVIRAAAEARVREAEDQMREMAEQLSRLQAEIQSVRSERDGVVMALELASERADAALRSEAAIQEQHAALLEMTAEKIEALQTERDSLRRRLNGRQEIGDGVPVLRPADFALTPYLSETVVPGDPQGPEAVSPAVGDEKAGGKAGGAEVETDTTEIVAEIARERDAAVEELERQRVETQAIKAAFEELRGKAARQAAWIREARERLSRHGLIRTRGTG